MYFLYFLYLETTHTHTHALYCTHAFTSSHHVNVLNVQWFSATRTAASSNISWSWYQARYTNSVAGLILAITVSVGALWAIFPEIGYVLARVKVELAIKFYLLCHWIVCVSARTPWDLFLHSNARSIPARSLQFLTICLIVYFIALDRCIFICHGLYPENSARTMSAL